MTVIMDDARDESLRRAMQALEAPVEACMLEAHAADRCLVGRRRLVVRVTPSLTAAQAPQEDALVGCVRDVLGGARLGQALDGRDGATLFVALALRPISVAWRMTIRRHGTSSSLAGASKAVPMYAPCEPATPPQPGSQGPSQK
jgi:hypothetical protein